MNRVEELCRRFDELHRRVDERLAAGLPRDEELIAMLREVIAQIQICSTMLSQLDHDLRQSHALIRALTTRYDELLNFPPDGILATDRLGIIHEANLAAAEILDEPQNRLLGKPLLVFIAPEHRQGTYLHLIALTPGQPRAKNWRINVLNRGGQLIPVIVYAGLTTDHSGEGQWHRLLIRPEGDGWRPGGHILPRPDAGLTNL